MIAIKGMDMPKNAKTCRFRHSIFNYCVIDKNRDTIKTDKFDKCLNCPLIDLPEENKDMSWEELKERIKYKKGFSISVSGLSIHFDTKIAYFVFLKGGDVLCNHTQIKINQKPFQMWQIILA